MLADLPKQWSLQVMRDVLVALRIEHASKSRSLAHLADVLRSSVQFFIGHLLRTTCENGVEGIVQLLCNLLAVFFRV